IPAAYCGITGLRPTTGRVSNHGVVPVSFTLDTTGPIAPSAEDCALVLDAIAGLDPLDASTVDEPVPSYAEALHGGVDGLRVGLVTQLVDRADPAIAEAVRAAVAVLADAGADVVDVEVPLLDEAGTILQLIMLPEASEVHLPWMRTRLEEYGADVRIRLLTGMMLPATSTATGRRARRWYCDSLDEVFARCDLLVAPQMLAQPPRIGEETVEVGGEELLYRLSVIPTNSPWTLAGLPVASVPCGFAAGMPVGLAVVGKRFAEATVLRAAHAFQRVTDWHERRPPLAG
ncbi:MAG TPA: amidase, partial [Gaiellaceae bacterium]|nr:amidase [Gaiellaceae bacterium]